MRFWMEITGDDIIYIFPRGFHAETPTPEKAYDHVSSKRRIAPGQKGILAENGLCSFQ